MENILMSIEPKDESNRILVSESPSVYIPHKFGEIIGVATMGPINPK